MSGAIRGIDSRFENGAQLVARDTRTLGARMLDVISRPTYGIALLISAITGMLILPEFSDLIFIVIFIVYAFAYTVKPKLPFRLPMSSKYLDYNDLDPTNSAPKQAAGISFFGNEKNTHEELWFNDSDLRTHVLMFGSTGSGKTEALISMAYNSLVQGSGFIYVDGKGDNSLFAKIFSMVRFFGREDDLMVINFMTGARDLVGIQENRLSNTLNPFAIGSSSMLSQLVVSLMDSSSGEGSADMWKGRAINFVESLMKILTIMRDEGHLLLDANNIRQYFAINKLETIVIDKKFPLPNGHLVPIDHLPDQFVEPLSNYIFNLPGYHVKNKHRQAGEVLEQHGFITMQLTRVFGSLADTYGHIIRTNLSEVDLKDIVLNRRILVVLLPALEKSPEELSNLGKIIIASLKAMMASGLGDAVEGNYRDVILRKPTNSPSPYLCIMDEYGYYAVKGFAVVAAQARSLGFSAVFAGQDLPAFQKASKEEAASIGANCNIKICMKLEDPVETWDYFNKTAGETYVTNVSGFQVGADSLTMNYRDNRSASVDRRQRIELLDLKDQIAGEAHIFFKSQIVRAKLFYANPSPSIAIKLNHLLKVERPTEDVLITLNERHEKFKNILINNLYKIPQFVNDEDINIMKASFAESYKLSSVDSAIAAIISILENELETQTEQVVAHGKYVEASVAKAQEQNESVIAQQSINMFSNLFVNPYVTNLIGMQNVNQFSKPISNRTVLARDLLSIERMARNPNAKLAVDNFTKNLEDLTTFPKQYAFIPNKSKFQQDLNQLVKLLGGSLIDFDNIKKNIPPIQLPTKEGLINLKPNNNNTNINTNFVPESQYKPLSQLPDLPDLPDLGSLDLFDFDKLPGLGNNDELSDLSKILKDIEERSKKMKELKEKHIKNNSNNEKDESSDKE